MKRKSEQTMEEGRVEDAEERGGEGKLDDIRWVEEREEEDGKKRGKAYRWNKFTAYGGESIRKRFRMHGPSVRPAGEDARRQRSARLSR